MLGVGHEVQALLAGLAGAPLKVGIGGDEHHDAGHDGEQGGGHGGGAVVRGGDQVLDLGAAGDGGHGDTKGAGGDGAGQQGPGQVGRTVDGVAHGVDNEHHDEQGDAAVGHQQAGQHHGQHGELGADELHQGVAQAAGGTGHIHDLAVDGAQKEGREPLEYVVGHALHVVADVGVQHVVAAEHSHHHGADGGDPDDGEALVGQEHQQHQAQNDAKQAHVILPPQHFFISSLLKKRGDRFSQKVRPMRSSRKMRSSMVLTSFTMGAKSIRSSTSFWRSTPGAISLSSTPSGVSSKTARSVM